MEFNPVRSWAVTYNHMWNLSMTNPITSGSNQSSFRRASLGGTGNVNAQLKKKIDYCWSFNKGLRCKFGKKCKFIERCSYCNATSHGVVNCDKLEKRDSGPAQKNTNNPSSGGNRGRNRLC